MDREALTAAMRPTMLDVLRSAQGVSRFGPDDRDADEALADVLAALERLGLRIVTPEDAAVAPNDVERYTSPDMFEAWSAGAQWMADRVELEDGELFIPLNEPCVEGRDWAEECGSWLNDFDAERVEGSGS